MIARKVAELRGLAEQRRLNLVGVQLDIDSPTGSLAEYADFLREVRKTLPPGMGISITALLDWFRDGTAVAEITIEGTQAADFFGINNQEKFMDLNRFGSCM